jgi:uncharacterized membrane protein
MEEKMLKKYVTVTAVLIVIASWIHTGIMYSPNFGGAPSTSFGLSLIITLIMFIIIAFTNLSDRG